ncbi:MAG: cell wall-binding repeat-containing protein [Coriobacteriia bacterium]|nr:cell wall-binding repeat-containing protein [Coriobacteriia bacterium]
MGFNFPDALGGGAALGNYGSPLLLTAPTSVPDSVTAFLEENEYMIGRADVFGGSDVVSDAVKNTIAGKLKLQARWQEAQCTTWAHTSAAR